MQASPTLWVHGSCQDTWMEHLGFRGLQVKGSERGPAGFTAVVRGWSCLVRILF